MSNTRPFHIQENNTNTSKSEVPPPKQTYAKSLINLIDDYLPNFQITSQSTTTLSRKMYGPETLKNNAFQSQSAPAISTRSDLKKESGRHTPQEDLTSSTFYHIDMPIPCKNRSFSIFKPALSKTLTKNSFHDMSLEQKSEDGPRYYFKKNPTDSIMSQLEAVAAGCYRLIGTSKYIPMMHPSYEKVTKSNQTYLQYIGVYSKEIPQFAPLHDEKNQGVFTTDDLKNPKVIKGLAIALVLPWFFEEEDLHRGQFSKYGYRVDFDMSLWPLFQYFKDGGRLAKSIRSPNKNTFAITAEDIFNFPHTKTHSPFYWPAHAAPVRTFANKFFPLNGKNAYTEQEILLFQSLKTNEDFKYEQYRIMLKIILTDESMYSNIAKQYLDQTIEFTGTSEKEKKTIFELLINHLGNRIHRLRETLISMPAFDTFLQTHGQRALDDIIEEFEIDNLKYEKKPENRNLIINTKRMRDEMFRKITDDIFTYKISQNQQPKYF